MDIRFGDHSSFHRAALGMTAGSAILGAALHPLTPLAPLLGGLFGIAVGAAFAYGKPAWRLVAVIAAALPLVVMSPSWPVLASSAGLIALGTASFARGEGSARAWRGALTVMLGATITLIGMWAALRFEHARAMSHWPAWTTGGAAAAAMGIVGVLAMLPRHLHLAIDPVQGAIRKLPADLDPEVRGLCDRSVAIWTDIKATLADTDAGLPLVRDGVMTTLEVAIKSADVKPAGASDEELGRRMEDLDRRITAATDPEVKSQYQSARAALSDQRRYRDHIRQNRERLVARMHNHVTALEKFQLAAGGLAAARAASTNTAAIHELQELSQDVAASGEALAEIELGTPATSTPATSTPAEPAAPAAQG
jgi:hypothetical protein